jgi:hypothetical protein
MSTYLPVAVGTLAVLAIGAGVYYVAKTHIGSGGGGGGGGCTTAQQCQAGDSCIGGKCVPAVIQCSSDSQCPSTFACQNGYCTANPCPGTCSCADGTACQSSCSCNGPGNWNCYHGSCYVPTEDGLHTSNPVVSIPNTLSYSSKCCVLPFYSWGKTCNFSYSTSGSGSTSVQVLDQNGFPIPNASISVSVTEMNGATVTLLNNPSSTGSSGTATIAVGLSQLPPDLTNDGDYPVCSGGGCGSTTNYGTTATVQVGTISVSIPNVPQVPVMEIPIEAYINWTCNPNEWYTGCTCV